jgi:hypothetical protein
MDYYTGINSGDSYLCDRCNVAKLRADEFNGNMRAIEGSNDFMRYCEECTNYIIIRKWKCNTCESTGSMRHERILPKVCCEENVIWLK